MNKENFRLLYESASKKSKEEALELTSIDIVLNICDDENIPLGLVKRFIDQTIQADLEDGFINLDMIESKSFKLNDWF